MSAPLALYLCAEPCECILEHVNGRNSCAVRRERAHGERPICILLPKQERAFDGLPPSHPSDAGPFLAARWTLYWRLLVDGCVCCCQNRPNGSGCFADAVSKADASVRAINLTMITSSTQAPTASRQSLQACVTGDSHCSVTQVTGARDLQSLCFKICDKALILRRHA